MEKVLKAEYKTSILNNVVLQAMIADLVKRSIETVKRWVRDNDSALLNFQVLELLKIKHSLNSFDQLFEKPKKEKAIA